MRIVEAAIVLAGLCALAAGAILLSVYSPRMELMPEDYKYDVVLEGTLQIPDGTPDQLVEYPVTVSRSQKVFRTEDRKAWVSETTEIISPSGPLPPGFGETIVEVAVDRETYTYVTKDELFMVADELPKGYFAFPPDVKRDSEYAIWIPEMFQALPARYVGSSQVDGLTLDTYLMEVSKVTVWSDSHGTLEREGDVRITYSVEPRSGVIVDQDFQIARRSLGTESIWLATFTSRLKYTAETVSANLDRARTERRRLMVIGTWLPWSILGLGMFLSVAGAGLFGARRVTARKLDR
jgi:hypothetical protein